MQTQETQNASNQSCLAANKGSRHSDTERNHTECKILTFISLALPVFGLVDCCNSALQKTKIVMRTHVL